MSEAKTVFVAGATGAQGGATVNALLKNGHKVIALSRNPASDAAKALIARGVDVREGQLLRRGGHHGSREGCRCGICSVDIIRSWC